MHLLAGDTQLTCATLNRHYSEMYPAIYVGVCVHVKNIIVVILSVSLEFELLRGIVG